MKNEKSNFWYKIGIIFIVIRTYIDNSELAKVMNIYDAILLPIIVAAFFLKLLNEKYSKREWLVIILITLICMYTSYITSKYVILMSCVALISLKNVNIKQVIKTIFITNVICLSLYTAVYAINYFYDSTNLNLSFLYKSKIRHTFYFNHPNMYSSLFFWTIAAFMYEKRNNLKLRDYMCVIVSSLFVFLFTKTRTLIICSAILIIFNFLGCRKNKIFYQFCKFFSKYGIIIMSVSCIIITLLYNNERYTSLKIIEEFDILFSRRFSLAAMVEETYGFTMFPRSIDYNMVFNWKNIYSSKLIIDNVFLQCALIYGIMYNVILSMLFFWGSKYNKDDKNYIYISLVIITGVVESYLMNVSIAFPILILIYNIFERNKVNIKENNNED